VQSHHLIGWLVIGLIAGALAGRLVEGRGLGCLANLVVGVAGAVIGVAFIGACLLLAVLRLLSGGRPLGGGRPGTSVR
jgi:uncharacterized membrane protein YeaQ/YmgE (transglycosylase-associated protein family)